MSEGEPKVESSQVPDGLSQSELREIAALRRAQSGHVSLMAVRSDRDCLLALVVAHTSQDAVAICNETFGEPRWRLGDKLNVVAVQRNVDLPPGFVMLVAWKRSGGEHSARTRAGRKTKGRKKMRRMGGGDVGG